MKNDPINPKHYTRLVITPREIINQLDLSWDLANVLKYVSRYQQKNGKEDLLKAKKYIELYGEKKEYNMLSRVPEEYAEEYLREYNDRNNFSFRERVIFGLITNLSLKWKDKDYEDLLLQIDILIDKWITDHGE